MAGEPQKPKLAGALDPRQVRTREALQSALLTLLQTRPLDEIRVSDLCETANIGYATFFRHHPTKESLLHELAADQIRQLIGLTLPAAEADDTRAASTALFTYVAAHRALWSTLLTGGSASAMREEFLRLAREVAATRVHLGRWPPTDVAIIVMVTSTIELVSWWLAQTKPPSIEQMAEIHEQLVLAPAMNCKTIAAARIARRAQSK
jgi:AcrR family transcriptional regulator